MDKLKLKKGDTIWVRVNYDVRQGVIDTIEGKDGDWMIQFTDPEHGPVYWKQHSDGGRVELLKSGPKIKTFAEELVEMRDAAESINDYMVRLLSRYPDVKVAWGNYGKYPQYDLQAAEVVNPSCPPVTLFYFTFWDDKHVKFSTLILVNDEAHEFDAYIYRVVQLPREDK